MKRKWMTTLKGALEGLGKYLDKEYLKGNIRYEGDIQAATVAYLKRELQDKDEQFFIGCEHTLFEYKPDVAVYHESMKGYFEDKENCVVGLIEIKFAAGIGRDLEKLETLQEKAGGPKKCLVWMIYGDHFNPDVHKKNFSNQRKREGDIKEWLEKDPSSRGTTILKLGCSKSDSKKDKDRRVFLNQNLWRLDKNSKFWT